MPIEDNKAFARRYMEELVQLYTHKNLTIIDELCVPDVVIHSSFIHTTKGLEAYKQTLSMVLPAFSDLQVTIEDQLAEGDRSAVRYLERGRHTGDLMGIKASGKEFHLRGIMIFRHAGDGKIVEVWDSPDTLSFMEQLGVIPARGSAK